MPQSKTRSRGNYETRLANRLLQALVAVRGDDGAAEGYMSEIAEFSALSRVQAQVGLRLLVETGRVVVERRGARNRPGRFRVVDATVVPPPGAVAAARERFPRELPPHFSIEQGSSDDVPASALKAMLTEVMRENQLLRQENNLLRERLDLIEARTSNYEDVLSAAARTEEYQRQSHAESTQNQSVAFHNERARKRGAGNGKEDS